MNLNISTSIESDKAPSVKEGSIRINVVLKGMLVTESEIPGESIINIISICDAIKPFNKETLCKLDNMAIEAMEKYRTLFEESK